MFRMGEEQDEEINRKTGLSLTILSILKSFNLVQKLGGKKPSVLTQAGSHVCRKNNRTYPPTPKGSNVIFYLLSFAVRPLRGRKSWTLQNPTNISLLWSE
jgi:hypothetical protein